MKEKATSDGGKCNENQRFYLKAEGLTYDMKIYDRWGNLFYSESKLIGGDASQAWMPSQHKVSPGVYVYTIMLYTDEGIVTKFGSVMVL